MSLIEPALAHRAIERALRRGGELAEVYAEERHGFGLTLDDRRVERPQSGLERGASVRVVAGEASYFGHVDGLREEDLLRVADSVAEAAAGGSAGHPTLATELVRGARHPVETAPGDVDPQRKAEILRRCDETARAAGAEVAQATVGYTEARRVVEVFNSDGVAAADDRTRVRLAVQVVARRDDVVETGMETIGGHAGFELVSEQPEEVAESAARKALAMLDARAARTGRIPVVVGAGGGGISCSCRGVGDVTDLAASRYTAWSARGPTVSPSSRQWSSTRGSAPSPERHEPGTAATSESCSRIVPPPRRPRRTVAATDAGVARRVQSNPQQLQSTGVRPSLRAASSDPVLKTP